VVCDSKTTTLTAQVPTVRRQAPIDPVQSVCDLVIFIDADLVNQMHVQRTVSRCFAILRQLRSVGHSVPTTTFQTHRLTGTVEAGLLRRLQSAMNAAARLIFGLPRQTPSWMHSSPSICLESRRSYCSRWPFSCTRPLMEPHRYT